MSTRRTRRPTAGGRRPAPATTRLATLGAAAALVLGGCTLGGDEPDTPDGSASGSAEQQDAEQQDAEQLGEAAETLSSGSPSAEPTPIEELPVVETRTASQDGQPMEVSLNGVDVDDRVMSVLFTVRNVGESRIQLSLGAFDDGIANEVPEGSEVTPAYNLGTADGVYVLDSANAKRHVVARDTSGACVCSADLGSVFISPDQQVVLTATFTAVPEDVETVSVVIPRAGEFTDVPVTR